MKIMKFTSSRILLFSGIAFSCLLASGANRAEASILSLGDINPAYSGDDPWILAEDLIVGNTGIGSLEISGGSRVESERGFVGNEPGSEGLVTVTGLGSTWNSRRYITVGSEESTGSLRIENGGSVNSHGGIIGYRENGSGSIILNGPGSRWDARGIGADLIVGHSRGEGELRVENGAVLQSSGNSRLGFSSNAYGKITVTGAGSVWEGDEYSGINVAHGGEGDLIISNGGVVIQDYITLGYSDSAWKTGTGLVSGPGSELNTFYLAVGYQGVGILTVENGGVVNVAGDTYVGKRKPRGEARFDNGTLNTLGLLATPDELTGNGTINATGLVTNFDLTFDAANGLIQQFIFNSLPGQSITLNLNASSPANTAAMGAGYRGSSMLTIADGVSVSGGFGYLGYNENSSGTALITGSGSAWNSDDDLIVGRYGSGLLRIENGGKVNVGGDIIVGYDGDYSTETSGVVNHTEGVVNIAGDLIMGRTYDSTGVYNLTGGELNLNGGDIVEGDAQADVAFNYDGGTIRGVGRIGLFSTFDQRGGTLAPGVSMPGVSIGTTTIESSGYTITSGTVEIELAHNFMGIPGAHSDLVDVIGNVDLLGIDGLADADLDIILDYSAPIGQVYTILMNDGNDPIIGTFSHGSTVETEYQGRLYIFDIDYAGGTGNDITLTLTFPTPGTAAVIGIGTVSLLRRRRASIAA